MTPTTNPTLQNGLNSTPKRSVGSDILAVTTIVALAAAQWFRPHLLANEAVYLIPPLQWWDAGLLATDWTWGGDPWRSTSLLFAWLAAPLWALSDTPEVVAMIGRLLSYTALAVSWLSLCRALHLGRRATVLAAALFLWSGQGYAAGEWMFLGFERKPFAHAAAMASVAALLRRHYTAAGLWTGLSIAFHILVGGWFGLATGAAMLAMWPVVGARNLVRFGAGAVGVAAPFAAMSVVYLFAGATDAESAVAAAQLGTSAQTAEPGFATWLGTAFRNPHHTIPLHFLPGTRALELLAMAVCAGWSAHRTVAAIEARAVIASLAVAMAAAAVGWLAGQFGWLQALQYYPFRLADVWVPALALMLAPTAVFRAFGGLFDFQTASTKDQASAARLVAVFLLFTFGACGTHLKRTVRHGSQRVQQTIRSWPGTAPASSAMGEWAREHTPRDATFVTPPCMFDFWIRARRPVVVGFKAMPHGPRAVQWYRRLTAIAGTPSITGVGFEVCKTLDAAVAQRDIAGLIDLGDRFGADFALLPPTRDDIRAFEVYRDGRFAVYDIAAMRRAAHSR